MVRFGKRFSKPGTAPATLRAPEVRRVEEVSISVMEYGPERLEEWQARSAEEALERRRLPALQAKRLVVTPWCGLPHQRDGEAAGH